MYQSFKGRNPQHSDSWIGISGSLEINASAPALTDMPYNPVPVSLVKSDPNKLTHLGKRSGKPGKINIRRHILEQDTAR